MIVDSLCVVGPGSVWSTEVYDSFELERDGIPGDRHFGPTRTVRRYQSAEFAGREIPNDRQLSVVDAGDMVAIADELALPIQDIEERSGFGVDRFMAAQLAANIMVRASGNRDLNAVATSGDVLVFGEPDGGAPSMRVTEYNKPCNQPVTNLVNSLTALGIGMPLSIDHLRGRFKEAAARRRGWVGSVYITGTVAVGHQVSVYRSLLVPES